MSKLIGHIFGEKKGLWYNIKKFFGWKIYEGIAIVEDDTIGKDNCVLRFDY